MARILYLAILLLITVTPVLAQNYQLSGWVLSSKTSLPLAGATVQEKGTKNRTTTDEEGKFTITTRESTPTLQISYIGYSTKEARVENINSSVSILLDEQTQQLGNVTVSTGYQTLPKERATGSFTVIDSTLINRSVSTDIISRLEGVANSVLFDKRLFSPTISIRGRSTIFGNDQPLIVLDNFPYEGDIKNINPNDVETITILKDAAAASIWGARAANGVIVITSKKGRYNQPPSVLLHNNVTIGQKPDDFSLPSMSSADFIEVEQFLFDKGFYNSHITSAEKMALSPVVEILLKKRNGVMSEVEATAEINKLKAIDVRNDYQKYLYQTSVNQHHFINIRGGGVNNKYGLSAGYDHNVDNLSATYNRFTSRIDNAFKLRQNLEVTGTVNYTLSKARAGKPAPSTFTSNFRDLYPYARLADPNGNPLPITKDYRENFIKQADSSGLLDWQFVPLEDYKYTDNSTTLQDVLLQLGVDYKLTRSLSATIKYQYEIAGTELKNLQGEQSYATRNTINRFTQVASNGTMTYPVPIGGILETTNNKLTNQAARAQLNYQNSWGRNSLSVIAGGEVRERNIKSSSNRTYGYKDDILTYATVNYDSLYRMYHNPGSRSRIFEGKSFSELLDRYISYYLNAAYSFKQRYTVSVSGRRDGSNLFGVNTNQKIVPLWSAGVSWYISNEPFYRFELIPKLKLRVTYGYNGNVDQRLTSYTTVRYMSTGNSLINVPYGTVTRLPNADLRWEKVGVINLGVDFELKNSKVNGSLELYVKNGKDLIGIAPVDQTIGWPFGTIQRNIAGMKTKGVDIEFNTKNIDGIFKWTTSFLFNYTANKLTDYDTSNTRGSAFVSSGINIRPLLAKPVYNIMTYQFSGLDPLTGDPLGIIGGQTSKDYLAINSRTLVSELVYHGSALPTVFGSLRNNFSIKNISLSFNLVYRLGYFFRRSSLNYSSLINNWRGHSDYTKRWQNSGDEKITNVPSLVYPLNFSRETFYANSSVHIDRGDNIRFQDVRIAYNLSRVNLSKLPFQNLEIYTYVNSLGVLWKKTKALDDPDFLTILPTPVSFSAGVRTNF